MSIFDLFLSKENIKNIKESISITINNEFQQKIGNRYDDLIENKMKELTQRVSDKVPEGKSKKDYILMMNKKLISIILPTIRANAIKEKPKTNIPTSKKIYDDPQDLLKKDNNNQNQDNQFNIPLEDMSQRFIPDYPRPNSNKTNPRENERNIYQSFSNGIPQNIPKFQDDLPEKRGDETLAMFNQLKASYEEDRIKNGEEVQVQVQNKSQNQPSFLNKNNDITFDNYNSNNFVEQTNSFQKKKVLLRKNNKFETPIDELNNNNDEKIKELLTPQIIHKNNEINHINNKKNNFQIHFSSNYRNFEYHKSSSSIRIYLTSYFDNYNDPFVYFSIPEYIDKHENMIYNSFVSKNNMKHHIHIPYLKNIESLSLHKIKLNKNVNYNKLYVEILPRIHNDENSENQIISKYYHNHIYEKRDLFIYDKINDIFINFNQNENIYTNIQQIIKNGYFQINIYNPYGDKLFYEKDILHIHKIIINETEDKNNKIFLHKKITNKDNMNNINEYKNKKIYVYSLLPEEDNIQFVEMNESVLLESLDMLIENQNKFKLCALYMVNDESHYKINFKELFDKCKKDLEDDEHKNNSDLFYFVIKQQFNGKPYLFYCNIDYIDELGNIILIHKEAQKIVNNYENTEQFGFIKKNYNGIQNNDYTSLFRKEGFVIQNVNIDENKEHIIFEIEENNISHINETEAFIRFDEYEIDLFLNIELN